MTALLGNATIASPNALKYALAAKTMIWTGTLTAGILTALTASTAHANRHHSMYARRDGAIALQAHALIGWFGKMETDAHACEVIQLFEDDGQEYDDSEDQEGYS